MESGEEMANGTHVPGMSHSTGEMILGDEVSHWRHPHRSFPLSLLTSDDLVKYTKAKKPTQLTNSI